jgi:CheY-like chemotaxis protein
MKATSEGWISCLRKLLRHAAGDGVTEAEKDQSRKILVVDDDPDVREVLVESLKYFGFSVVEAGSGEEALPLLESADDIGMLITDVRMPGMSGLELADRARRRDLGLKVIVISGYFLPQSVGERFLKKPFHMHELASAIRAELD